MRRLTAILIGGTLVLVSVSVSACGGAGFTTNGRTHNGTPATSPAPTVTITGGSPAQRSLLQSIADSLNAGIGVASIDIGTPAVSGQAGNGLTFALTDTQGAAFIRSEWEAFLIAGTFRDASANDGLPAIGSVSLSNGTMINLETIDHPAVTVATPDTAAIESGLASLNLTGCTTHSMSPDGYSAIAVSCTTSDPASFVSAHAWDALSTVFVDVNAYDGVYLEVTNSAGDPIYVAAYASRAAHGSTWMPTAFEPGDGLGATTQSSLG